MRILKSLVLGAALLALAGPSRALADGDDEEEGGLSATLVAAVVDPAAPAPAGSGQIRIEAEDGGELKMKMSGLADPAGAPLNAIGGGKLDVTESVNGGPPVVVPFMFDVVNGEGRVRGTLGLAAGDVLEIQAVKVTIATTQIFVPGVVVGTTHGSDFDDGDQGQPSAGSVARDGVDESGYRFFASLVADADTGDLTFDPAGDAHVVIDGRGTGSVQMRITGVIDPATMLPPAEGHPANLNVIAKKNGVDSPIAIPFTLTGGVGEVSTPLGLAIGDVLEIQNVTVDDGDPTKVVFAVVGQRIADASDDDGEHDDGDHDGVPDTGDSCTSTATGAVVSPSGCSLQQLCGCPATLRACTGAARTEISARIRTTCKGGKRCRKMRHQLAVQRRQLLRSCH